MLNSARTRLRGATTVSVIVLAAGMLAACASTQPKSMIVPKKKSKEYFSETEYGVKASPRVSTKQSRLARGGGRDQIGKPYKVRGKVYYPKEEKNYAKTGLASWYGDAFHGRLTANGEIYDMTHLTAAHPTMPLPSYARVTNTENGSSVVVRVNDRGPYAHGRLIDLSKRAAEMLDYTHSGVATVKVEYMGRAPLDGQDDEYLMASYRPGDVAPDPSDGLPTGVMIAMNGPTPTASVSSAVSFPGELADAGNLALPAFGPIAPERPAPDAVGAPFAMASLSYAQSTPSRASTAFAALESQGLTPDAVVRSWKRMNDGAPGTPAEPYIAAGSFTLEAEAEQLARTLAAFGRTEIETSEIDGTLWYGVNLRPDGRGSLDDLLQSAWQSGASDAITVRD
ncbi:MAG: septal ring lytic transglycosylase RlpA family protein [Alphaproteobacteria bacterium]|nr:septal ring lytic transglycosylase RlpA family protein [Alphaproteobacteria bacterium]MBU0802755.1 septal ring lytic transglycosylase RlpA family protein [Alphaproteobacteria bacterium]MBU0871552.1 septal ring lytic transglycosylase RlpA family protein [Alphaproteobacteria bacterium]MBU1400219.1 septal ring lytic transglycosylase RlpA family protein [Alphaproteobacteria bacterium]MBU1591339.1 septal ring lytic transglycosylase RlpA family protein [Alphaproteobacteria bacterium]